MKVALCAIGRLENQYAVEYVEHYIKLGFDKIFIYDNNHDEEEHFEDVLQQFIDNGLVEIVSFRNKEVAQISAYNDCYRKYGNDYDWMAFFDFDEFLTLVECDNIKTYLSNFDGFDCVKINWMVYTDNDLLINDYRPLLERFTTPMEYDKCVGYSFPENNHVKSIVRGKIDGFRWGGTPHTPGSNLRYCNSLGEESNSSPFQPYNFSKAYLKHFTTKTIDEYINNKRIRGVADRSYSTFNNTYKIDNFFKINNRTVEKEEFIKKKTMNDNIDIFICTHKEFEKAVNSDAYKIINSKEINPDLPLKDDFYSELYQYKHVNDNIELKKYVGFCHYRRYFSFLDNIPDIDEMFKEYDAITSKPIVYKSSIKEVYGRCHNIEDLYIVGGIIADKYPQYSNMWHSFINGKVFIPYNMFIMKSEDFKEYINFIFDILDEYLKIVGTDINKRIYDNYEKYIKDMYPNNTVEYQYRIGGYLAERLTNLFILSKYKKIKTYPVIVTENKYKIKKEQGN